MDVISLHLLTGVVSFHPLQGVGFLGVHFVSLGAAPHTACCEYVTASGKWHKVRCCIVSMLSLPLLRDSERFFFLQRLQSATAAPCRRYEAPFK